MQRIYLRICLIDHGHIVLNLVCYFSWQISDQDILAGFDFDGEYFYVGGMNLVKSTKHKNVQKNNKVAIIIDDLKTADPWDPRGVRIYGTADIVTRQGGYMDRTGHSDDQYIRITPYKKWSWGIEEPVFVEGKFNVKRAKRD